MTKLLDRAVETAQRLAPERQDEIAHYDTVLCGHASDSTRARGRRRPRSRRGGSRARRVGDGRTDARHLGEASTLKLRYSDRAAHQIEAALDYIAELSLRGAATV